MPLEVLTLLGVISKEGDFFHANRLTKEKFNDFFQLSKIKNECHFWMRFVELFYLYQLALYAKH